jgi:hypothetical protein
MRKAIADYEKLVEEVTERLSRATHAAAVAFASLALNIRGLGHVKLRNYRAVKAREAALLRQLRSPRQSPLRRLSAPAILMP